MKCLTDKETSDWLDERSIFKDPYTRKSTSHFYLQFYAPKTYQRIDGFIRDYYKQIVPNLDSLIHITDWGLYQQSEMIAIAGIRSGCNEDRPLIDASGHVLTSAQKEIGVSLFSHSTSFGWSSYLYSAENHSILFNWEGEILDFWTDSEQVLSEMKLLLKSYDLKETNPG